jgi:hypothetical protein
VIFIFANSEAAIAPKTVGIATPFQQFGARTYSYAISGLWSTAEILEIAENS